MLNVQLSWGPQHGYRSATMPSQSDRDQLKRSTARFGRR